MGHVGISKRFDISRVDRPSSSTGQFMKASEEFLILFETALLDGYNSFFKINESIECKIKIGMVVHFYNFLIR